MFRKIFQRKDDNSEGAVGSDDDNLTKKEPKEKKSFSIWSLLSWLVLFGIGYVIGLYIDIPTGVSYGLIFLFGILAIILDIEDSKMRWLKQIPLLRHHFSIMHRINKKIGDSAQAGTVKGAFQFLWGMIVLIFYLFWINVLLNLIKLALSLSMSEVDPIKFLESFIALLSAGVIAYIVWLKAFYNDFVRIKSLAGSKKIKEKMKSIGKLATFLMKLLPLGWTFAIWILGEVTFLYISQETDWISYFLSFAGLFFVIITLILIGITFLSKSAPKRTPIEEHEESV